MHSDNDEQLLENINQNFAAILKKLRKENSLTQNDLSDRSGLSMRMIIALEAGDRRPSLLTLFKLAKGLNIGMRELIERLLTEMGV